ncbi:hypothetical protein [Adhaeribacter pallidiroseus]|uniref:Uncharacterized protein n=1 Tax=Adhaeribacter pallidiroseus TaxID=2072847 RepID=A0A369QNN9_9BACT|nr:hypothetical protein [Adhaeribacter pallidiroseus]RDC64877.1 hypothetical protein AHMF7616_03499 [Adhaeribacter pallidiroseus]
MKTFFTRAISFLQQHGLRQSWQKAMGLYLLLQCLMPAAQAQKIQWDKTLGGKAEETLRSVQQTRDGGYIVGGYSESGKGGDKSEKNRGNHFAPQDYWVVKLKVDGTKAWDKTFGGKDSDRLTAIQQTSDNGYILGGYSDSGKNNDKSEDRIGVNDYWLVKLDAAGNKEWDKTLGGDQADYLTAIVQTPDGGYVAGGYSDSGKSADKSQSSKGSTDYWLIKINAQGQKVWDVTVGGNGQDNLISLQLTQDGGFILGGSSQSGISGDKTETNKGGEDYWVVKLNATGQKEWDKTLGGARNDYFAVVQPTPDQGYMVGGSSESDSSSDKSENNRGVMDEDGYISADYWVVKLNAAGAKVWDKTIGGNSDDALSAIQQVSDGSYVLGGSSFSGVRGINQKKI